jgi:phenylacetate-CoA ligase
MIGVRKSDVFPEHDWIRPVHGRLGPHYGAERLGLPHHTDGPGNTRRQLKFMKDFGVGIIHVIPELRPHQA